MPFTFLTGGARSGKSIAAERMASAAGAAVTFVATAEAGDDEMAARIDRHRSGRPADWETIEEPIDLVRAVRSVPPSRFVIVDCLTLWVSNCFEQADGDVVAQAERLGEVMAARPGGGVVVSNEVGDGIVPADPATRRYRDLLGSVNRVTAEQARQSFLMVAGRTVPLEPMPW